MIIPFRWIFMLYDLHLVPFCTAFCTISPCILHQNALHLAPKRIAFSTKTHCVLHHIAMILATNSSQMGANGYFLK